ncbi:hypothetical protein LCGC14_2319520 [marine sediment metagenome]|uniref:Uncharacterized protein n=1 Tax=marine sediment metagenome TaxID=412755 RepID=A0A0F9D5R9_9ZZZZ
MNPNTIRQLRDLRDAGWKEHEDPGYPGSELWTHERYPDKEFVRNAAIMRCKWDNEEDWDNYLETRDEICST